MHVVFPIPWVANDIPDSPYDPTNPNSCDNPACFGGLCWAACIAMIVNYYRGTEYEAIDIHNIAGCLSEVSTYLPYRNALVNLGVYSPSASFLPFTYTTALNLVEGNRLALMQIERTDDNGNVEGHFVVPCGYYCSSDQTFRSLSYQDPNFGGGAVEFPESGPLMFPVGADIFTYQYYITAYL